MATDYLFNYDNHPDVHYRYQPAKYDCQHLLIVMSGFNIPDPTIYDFSQALAHCRSHILWIKDDFNGLPAYYLCNNMDFKIEFAVSQLICNFISHLKPVSTSIMGGSKGGSAALYFGAKHKFDHIISCVPQFNIGSYVAADTYWEHVGRQMMGNQRTNEQTNIAILDGLLRRRLAKSTRISSHIYLFTSTSDPQYQQHIVPHLPLLRKFNHFNLINTHSTYVTEHVHVTAYNVPLILALIALFEHQLPPTWGEINNGAMAMSK